MPWKLLRAKILVPVVGIAAVAGGGVYVAVNGVGPGQVVRPPGGVAFVAAGAPGGTAGTPYFYDFCGPGAVAPTQKLSTVQCSPGAGGTPSGGHPPYHFQLDSGSGFPPQGLHLQKDGVLNGTPGAASPGGRPQTFRVCAVDLDANQACATVAILIAARARPEPPRERRYTGTWQVGALSAVCPASGGAWSGTLTIAGGRLTGTWRDSYHGNQEYRVDTAIADDGRARWTVDSGSESITLSGTFDVRAGTVRGTLVGPVCTSYAGRWNGTFRGAAK